MTIHVMPIGENPASTLNCPEKIATTPTKPSRIPITRIPGERLPGMRVFGILLGFVGVVAIFSGQLSVEAGFSPIGMTCIVIGAALQAYALVSVRLKGQNIHPATLTFGGMIIGAAGLSATSLLLEDYSRLVVDTRAIVSTLYLAAFGSVITFITYFWLVKHVNPVLLSLTAF